MFSDSVGICSDELSQRPEALMCREFDAVWTHDMKSNLLLRNI
jgi:hypothetical protein